jgi:hypothetical protein
LEDLRDRSRTRAVEIQCHEALERSGDDAELRLGTIGHIAFIGRDGDVEPRGQDSDAEVVDIDDEPLRRRAEFSGGVIPHSARCGRPLDGLGQPGQVVDALALRDDQRDGLCEPSTAGRLVGAAPRLGGGDAPRGTGQPGTDPRLQLGVSGCRGGKSLTGQERSGQRDPQRPPVLILILTLIRVQVRRRPIRRTGRPSPSVARLER